MTATDLALQWLIAGCIGLVLRMRGRMTLFHSTTVYWWFHVFAFCLRPTLIALGVCEGAWIASSEAAPGIMRQVLWVSSAGLAVFSGVFLAATWRAPMPEELEPTAMDRSDQRALLMVALACLGPAVACGWLSLAGGRVNGLLAAAQWMIFPIGLLAIVATRWRWWSVSAVAACVVFWGSTHVLPWSMIGGALALIALWLWSNRRLHAPPALTTALVFGSVALALLDPASLSGFWGGASEAPREGAPFVRSIGERLDRPEFAQFEAVCAVVSGHPAMRPFSRGSQHLDRLGGRSMVAGRTPVDRPGRASMPLVGDGWISGGWPGMLATQAVAALLLGLAWRAFTRRPADPARAVAFLGIQALSIPLVLSSESGVVPGLVWLLLPILAWRALAERMRRSEQAESTREQLREERQRRRLLGTALLNPHAAPLPVQSLPGEESPASRPSDDPAAAVGPETAGSPTSGPAGTPGGSVPAARPSDLTRPRWRDGPGT